MLICEEGLRWAKRVLLPSIDFHLDDDDDDGLRHLGSTTSCDRTLAFACPRVMATTMTIAFSVVRRRAARAAMGCSCLRYSRRPPGGCDSSRGGGRSTRRPSLTLRTGYTTGSFGRACSGWRTTTPIVTPPAAGGSISEGSDGVIVTIATEGPYAGGAGPPWWRAEVDARWAELGGEGGKRGGSVRWRLAAVFAFGPRGLWHARRRPCRSA